MNRSPEPTLEDLLKNAPFGLLVRREDGTVAFANTPAFPKPEEGKAFEVERQEFAVEANGHSYVLGLTLDVSQQRLVENELFAKAYFDELTRLPNRSLIETAIHKLTGEARTPFALAFIDLDGFKNINDFYGHSIGDELLVQFARRVTACLLSSDILARQSGDEFLLLLTDVENPTALNERLTAISEAMRRPYHIDGYEIFSSASVGISRFPTDGSNYNALVSSADRAMYRGKKAKKGSVQFFDASIEHVAAEKSRLEQRLRLAIRDRRMCCAYQPKVAFRTGEVVGVEALMRWRDEDGLIHAPGGMIELAVELGLMDELTHLIIDETAKARHQLDAVFGPEITTSLNIAAKQATNIPFMQSLVDVLAMSGRATSYMIELTEEALLAKTEFQTHVLPMLREAGIRVAIDDFGVGYSSLATLADVTADEVKVDRSFITSIHSRPRSQSILKAIESLGNSLGMSVVVEGVETFEELAYLQAATRIQIAQGYYFARPMLIENLVATQLPSERTRTLLPSRLGDLSRTGALRERGLPACRRT